jgi:hypothetical protein
MTTVDIADIDAALGKVRAFLSLLEQNHATWDKTGICCDPSPQQTQTDNQVQERLPLIGQIAVRADANLIDSLQKDSAACGWPCCRALGCIPAARRPAQLPGRARACSSSASSGSTSQMTIPREPFRRG